MNKKHHVATLAVTIAVCGALFTISGSAQAAVQGALPTKLALKAAEAALAACEAGGYSVTVAIVDREGVTRLMVADDGAGPVGILTSRRKAFTAAALGISTGAIAAHVKASGEPFPPLDPEILILPGGLPIRSHGVVIAGVGVGGADKSEKDEACAQAGIDAIAGELN